MPKSSPYRQEIADVQVGQSVVLKARAYPAESVEGTATSIALAAVRPDQALDQKIIRVITTIDNTPLLLKSQMTGNAKIYCDKRTIAERMTRRLVRYLRVELSSGLGGRSLGEVSRPISLGYSSGHTVTSSCALLTPTHFIHVVSPSPCRFFRFA